MFCPGSTLYIAVVGVPPHRAVANGYHSHLRDRDAELVFDPNVLEIWLDPIATGMGAGL
jgi:hypothetical protein